MLYTKTVYSVLYPEVSNYIKQIYQQPEIYELHEDSYLDGSKHEEKHFREAYLLWVHQGVQGLHGYKHFYPTAGSSEAIREVLGNVSTGRYNENKTKGTIHVFKGEYEGFAALSDTVVYHDRNSWTSLIDGGEKTFGSHDLFVLSEPSSIDGNCWSRFGQFVDFCQANNISVAVDLAYIGALTTHTSVPLGSPCIKYVFISLSKCFGTYFRRIGGVFSREPVPGLIGNQWFKNLDSLYIGRKLMEKFSLHELPMKYANVQFMAVELALGEQQAFKTDCADVFMLANSYKAKEAGLGDCIRTDNNIARICLTPAITKLLKGEIKP